jgi:hypothetical protein
VGELAAVTKLDHNPLKNTGDVFEDLIVPEADDAPSLGFEPCGAPQILRLSPTMLTAIDLDDERSLDTNKVGDVWAERDLSAEAIPTQLFLAYALPQPELRVGRVAAQTTGAIWP